MGHFDAEKILEATPSVPQPPGSSARAVCAARTTAATRLSIYNADPYSRSTAGGRT